MDTIEDRIFICLGKNKKTEQDAVWVMTLNQNYDQVTFWDPKLYSEETLKYRIRQPEYLKFYLSPDKFKRDWGLKEKMHMEKVVNWRDEFKKDDLDDQDMDSAPTEESMDKDDGNLGGAKKKLAKGKDDSDDEGG